jgi:hypothetical protein
MAEMIYIKDYRFINEQLRQSGMSDMNSVLIDLVGKVITVFTSSGGVSGNGFTGILSQANRDSLLLTLCLPPPPYCSFSRSHSKHAECLHKSTVLTQAIIPISQICAIALSYV